jgi:hypothetical protein
MDLNFIWIDINIFKDSQKSLSCIIARMQKSSLNYWKPGYKRMMEYWSNGILEMDGGNQHYNYSISVAIF